MIKQDRMDHIEVGAALGKSRVHNKKFEKAVKEIRDTRIADERREKEKEIDEWFKNLTILQRSDVAYSLWEDATFEEKREEYLAV